jgi:sucrose-phosphate synthase
MYIAFLNIHGNFDPHDRYWTAHPDFGGQLVYVKELTCALGRMGHKVDIITRRIRDAQWPGFESDIDGYPGEPNVRIVRIPCGGDDFLRKQDLWPFIGTQWVPNIVKFYEKEGLRPDVSTAHYGDSGLAAALWQANGGPQYTFTAHSLGAQKLERLLLYNHTSAAQLDKEYYFARRITAERVAMNHAARIITSTRQEYQSQYGHAAYRDAIVRAPQDCFRVVPPGVNLHVFDAGVRGPDDERIATHLEQVIAKNIHPDRRELPMVICSSRLEPKKNHVGLVLAFARSPELQAAANLLLVVRGIENIREGMGLKEEEKAIMDQVVAACEGAELWGKVCGCSLENQQELAAAYRHLAGRRSVFALTALYEPFGLAPLEAMAAGLPACVTRCGGPSESLYDEASNTEFGVLVDPADPHDIAKGLLRLVGPENQWQHFRDVGRKRVLERYTWEATARGYVNVLEDILEHAPSAVEQLPIPAYFTDPRAENDISLETLKDFVLPTQ